MSGTPVLLASEMQQADRLAIEDAGIPGVVLMENAGAAVAREVLAILGATVKSAFVAVVCGRGNNGGDGFVVARHLAQRGVEVECLLVASRDDLKGDAHRQMEIVDTLGIPVHEIGQRWTDDSELAIDGADVIVDALFGIGLERPILGFAAQVITRMNASPSPVVAIDLPSGVHADSGRVLGAAVIAERTVTCAFPKRGICVHPGIEYAGQVVIADIGIPPAVIEHIAPRACLNDDFVVPYLPARARESHKGHFGHILVIGGQPGKSGAVLLAGVAALRSGAGLVTVATHAAVQSSLEGRVPELMIEAVFDATTVDRPRLEALLDVADVVVVGPGMPTGPVGHDIVRAVLERGELPVVLDAGGLDVAGRDPALFASRASPLVITPHPGEAGRLLGIDSATVQADRFAALTSLVQRTMAITVLKGPRTLIGVPEGDVAINTTGNSGMATAGAGDVLAGIIGALLARELDAWDAVRLAVYLHGLAGDAAASEVGEDSLIASDIIAALPGVIRNGPAAA